MAGIAYVGGIDMRGGFTAGDNAVVTTTTSTNHLIMVHRASRNRRPGRREFFVASLANIGRVNVRCPFTAGIHAVMTGNAISKE